MSDENKKIVKLIIKLLEQALSTLKEQVAKEVYCAYRERKCERQYCNCVNCVEKY